MVVKITSPHNIQRALNYNEKKVQRQEATCLFAGNFLKEANRLSFREKLSRFSQLILLNERTKKSHSLHISLNFHPSEYLREDQLIRLASAYMNKIGFGTQPFLVYKHTDAGHPHIHILTTNIKPDGVRIDTFNIGRNQSEKARQQLEAEFGLIKAAGRRSDEDRASIEPLNSANYGKEETKKALERVILHVLKEYQFTSLPALNALLGLYRVRADTGKPGGRIEKFKGLRYQMLDNLGKPIGVPIKASVLSAKPTLEKLEQCFKENSPIKAASIQKLRHKLNQVLTTGVTSFESARSRLLQHHIVLVLRQNDQGRIYGLTFVDQELKGVFNGSEIGKGYSAAAFQQRFPSAGVNESTSPELTVHKALHPGQSRDFHSPAVISSLPDKKLLSTLFDPDSEKNALPFELSAKKRKRKRKLNG